MLIFRGFGINEVALFLKTNRDKLGILHFHEIDMANDTPSKTALFTNSLQNEFLNL